MPARASSFSDRLDRSWYPFQTLAEFLTLCPLHHVYPLPIARDVNEGKISDRGALLTSG